MNSKLHKLFGHIREEVKDGEQLKEYEPLSNTGMISLVIMIILTTLFIWVFTTAGRAIAYFVVLMVAFVGFMFIAFLKKRYQ